jgi:hypothetical protein
MAILDSIYKQVKNYSATKPRLPNPKYENYLFSPRDVFCLSEINIFLVSGILIFLTIWNFFGSKRYFYNFLKAYFTYQP